jgi:HAD superfamily hydrolase (TIGR01509 family)
MTDSRPAILFDVDGTLVDTNWFHTVAWWRAFRDIGEQAAMAKIHPLIGMGSDHLVEAALGHDSDEASAGHSRYYEPFKDETTAFPKAAELLKVVANRGGRVVLATSADKTDVDRLTEAIGAGDAVEHVVCKDDAGRSKPDPDIFKTALEYSGASPDQAIVVGDTVWDVRAATELGLRTVGVLTGAATKDQLQDEGAVAVYEDVAELLDQLDDSPLGTLLDAEAT